MNLTESQKKIAAQIEARMVQSSKRVRESDEMTRGIAYQDRLLIKNLGAGKAAEIVTRMTESIPLSNSRYDVTYGGETEFSFKNLREALCDLEEGGHLKEAGAESTYGALLRLGVTNIIANAFKLVPLVWDKVVMTTTSNGLYGVYGSTFRPGLPKLVGAGQEFPETSVDPMGDILPNQKWGVTLAFQNEALEDDQTGELAIKSSEVGENMAIWQELSFAAYLSDTALTEADLTITPGTYTDPDGTTGVYATTGNRKNAPSAIGTINQNTLRVARATLKKMRQPNGMKVLVNPNTLVYHPDDEQTVEMILKSPNWNFASNTNDTAGTSTVMGAPGGMNPLQGKYTPVECRYLTTNGTNGAWFLGQSKSRSLLFQNRDGLQTLQESPASGKSFDMDLSRWRNRQRGAWAWLLGGARFWYRGSTGA